MRKQTRCLLLLVGLCGLAACLIDGVQTIRWSGSADLTVEFEVADAETGAPIRGAEVSILSEGGVNADGRRLEVAGLQGEAINLTTDDAGIARYVCRDSKCSGTQSFLSFTNTYGVNLPWWHVTTKAPGYAATGPFVLNERPNRRAPKRVGPQQAKLVVPVVLHKSP
jgi:hypothetical protein